MCLYSAWESLLSVKAEKKFEKKSVKNVYVESERLFFEHNGKKSGGQKKQFEAI